MGNFLKKHVFCFNECSNGGESLILSTEIFGNGDPNEIYYNQKLTLNSYANCASIELFGVAMTPDSLRKLADELEAVENEAKFITRKVC